MYVSVRCIKLMYITLHPVYLRLRNISSFMFFIEKKIANARRQKQPNSYFQCGKFPSKTNYFTQSGSDHVSTPKRFM